MGKFFEDKFKKNSQQCNCSSRMGSNIDVNETIVDIQFEDPNDIIDEYFKQIINVNSEEEIQEMLTNLFYEGVIFGVKEELLDDIQMKVEMLHSLEYGYDDGT